MKINHKNRLIRELFILIIVIIIFTISPVQCFFFDVLGFPCPGCGLTRAFFSLLSLNFKGAFLFNPTIYILPFYFLFYVYNYYIKEKPSKYGKWVLLSFIVIMLVVYIIRMILFFPNEVPLVRNKEAYLVKFWNFIR